MIPALLILCITDIHPVIINFVKETQIATFIHAKNPNLIDESCKKYIIKKYVSTKWGDVSIINATIALIREAMQQCNYFILISGDTIINPNLLENIKKHKGRSIFCLKNIYANIYATSQWWCMTKPDAQIILSKGNKYINKIKNRRILGAPDELFFLTVLQAESRKKGNATYLFDNAETVYARWIDPIVKHPSTFCRLTNYDLNIYHNSIIGMRKCIQSCMPVKYPLKHNAIIAIVGTKTDQIKLSTSWHDHDIIILSPLESINVMLRERAVSIAFLYYGTLNNFIILYLTKMQKYLEQWNSIKLIDENGQEIHN